MSGQNRRNPRAKWVLPDVIDPPDRICFKISVPNNRFHIAAFRGALYMLSSAIFWQDDIAHTAKSVARVWQDIFDNITVTDCVPVVGIGSFINTGDFMSDLVQVICDSSGKCVLQYRCDVCSPWQTVANITDLQTNPPGTGNQPAPGGGSAAYCKTVYAYSSIVIPTPVSTGDKIEVISADGNWSYIPFVWRCVDGNLFFIDCQPLGAITNGSDFVPGAPQMSLIVQFSTGYYALYPSGSLVVPSGVLNEQPTLLANKPTLLSGDGQIDVCIKVTNNHSAPWCRFYDLTASAYTFTADNGGVWTPGVGFVGSVTGSNSNIAGVGFAYPATTLTEVDMTYTQTTGAGTGSDANEINNSFPAGANLAVRTPGVYGTNLHYVWSGSVSSTGVEVLVASNAPATLNISGVKLTGNGTPPPGGVPC